MAKVTSKHDAVLHLPSGPSIRPGATVNVLEWDTVKDSDMVKAWLAAEVITVEEAEDEKPKDTKPEK